MLEKKDIAQPITHWREILESLGYKLINNGKDIRTSAVWRNGNNATSVVIYPEQGKFYDYGEQMGGSIKKLIALTKGIDEGEIEDVLDYIEKKPHVTFTQAINIPRVYSDECLTRLTRDYSYFESRGISKETQMVFEAGFCTRESFAGRMVFPIRDFHNKIIGFTGRWTKPITNGYPKWLIKGPKRFFVYNHRVATPAIKEKNQIILVESIGDVLSLYECGIHNAICLFGLNISSGVIKYLISLNCEIIIATNKDGDDKGNHGENGAKLIQSKLLKYFNPSKIKIKLPTSNDFNEMLCEESGRLKITSWYKSINNINTVLTKNKNIVEYTDIGEYYS